MRPARGPGAHAAGGGARRSLAALALASLALARPGAAAGPGDCGESAIAGAKAFRCPAPAGARYPRLAPGPGSGTAVLSWIEDGAGERHSLRFSILHAGSWSEPRTIVTSESLFVNWADFPVVAAFADSLLAAAWPARVGGEPYAYHLRASVGSSGGTRWTEPVTVHADRSPTEHGFVSVESGANDARLVWLDGHKYAGREPGEAGVEMTLHTALLGRDGAVREERELDGRTCDCCNTAVATSGGATLVAYRDRDAGEIRDLAFVRWREGGEPERGLLHADGWEIRGCPVNGPALAADPGGRLGAAWYTEAAGRPRVRFAPALERESGTAAFGPPVTLADRRPLGRVGIAAVGPCEYAVTWFEARGERADVMVRLARADGTTGPPVRVGTTSAKRGSGFPQVHTVRGEGGNLTLVAWTEPGDRPRIRLARLVVR